MENKKGESIFSLFFLCVRLLAFYTQVGQGLVAVQHPTVDCVLQQ
jgi:hypothetical protein